MTLEELEKFAPDKFGRYPFGKEKFDEAWDKYVKSQPKVPKSTKPFVVPARVYKTKRNKK